MNNANALIAMAQVSQNANNPYFSFCEYIKYCMHTNSSDVMTIEEVRNAVGQEFGVYLPYNIELKCISILKKERKIACTDHQLTCVGKFDIDGFDERRRQYRATEILLIRSLMDYVSNYGQVWDEEYARKQLINVLDGTGLAYDIFFKVPTKGNVALDFSFEDFNKMILDGEEVEKREDDEKQPIFSDRLYVGKFVKKILNSNSIEKEYLCEICKGLMICAGAFQIPSVDAELSDNQRIKGTCFFFDTKLLLRFVGCAGEAAVQSAKELVKMIQDGGGKIYYYPQTLEEINCAFENAIRNLQNGYPPFDNEMRLYANSVKRNFTVIAAKKAGIVAELAAQNIHEKELENYSDTEQIRFGFSKNDLQQYMQGMLQWDTRAIENDATSIWETHMLRQGNYSDYCGGKNRLPVFVTTNARLVGVALNYREERPAVSTVNRWRSNRLPVITDMRLTCRLWSPAQQGDRISLLYLTANAVAAQRPTPRYINRVRELAIEIEKEMPEYSQICLAEFFDDNITDSVLKNTSGVGENLNIGTFANSIYEISELRAKEEEKRTEAAKGELNEVKEKYNSQINDIIDGAIEKNKKNWGKGTLYFWIIRQWQLIAAFLFAVISATISSFCGNWKIMWAITVPIIVFFLEKITASKFVELFIAKWLVPKAEQTLEKRINNALSKAEIPYKDTIILKIKKDNVHFSECKRLIDPQWEVPYPENRLDKNG